MLGELIKALELLLGALKGVTGSDSKRQNLAKELSLIHLTIDEIVNRGRAILELAGDGTMIHLRSHAIRLLREQEKALEDLVAALSGPAVGEILRLHLPSVRDKLFVLIEIKGERVWFTLDQLLSQGNDRAEVVRDAMERLPERHRWAVYPRPRLLSELRLPRHHNLVIVANAEELQKGQAVLDHLSDVNERIRCLLTEKFKVEDVL